MKPIGSKLWYGCYLGDASLHDEEVRIVHIELNRMEKILDLVLLNCMAVYHVFVLAPDDNLSETDAYNVLCNLYPVVYVPVW
jgi:hypothetical protein